MPIGKSVGSPHYIDPIRAKMESMCDTVTYLNRDGERVVTRKDYDFKKGDRVYCLVHGWGTVAKVEEYDCNYPVGVDFDNKPNAGYTNEWFTDDGKYRIFGNRTLYFDVPIITDAHVKVTYRKVEEPKYSMADAVADIRKIIGRVEF